MLQPLTSGDGTYRIPDNRVRNIAFDSTLALKTASTPQVRGFFANPGISAVVIVRPTVLGGPYFIPRSK